MCNTKVRELEEFLYGTVLSQRVSFSIDDHSFFMIFTPVILDCASYVDERESIVGFSIPERSFDVKFDRAENFESGDFYAPPSPSFSFMGQGKMRRLGKEVCELIEFHCSITDAQAYFASAERHGLKRFYDRLAVEHANELKYEVLNDLGEEGLDYAIKTPKFKNY